MSIRLKDTITDSIDKLDGQHSSYFAHTVKVGDTSYNSNSSVVSLPAYPTTLPNPKSLSWSGSSTGSYNGSTETSFIIPTVPTKLSSFTDDVVSGKYLPLSGGTLTKDSNSSILQIKNTSYDPYISFVKGSSTMGHIMVDENKVLKYTPQGSDSCTILHSDNWSQFITINNSSDYLPLSGGTLNGTGDYLYVPLMINALNNTISGVTFKTNGTERGHVGYHSNIGVRLHVPSTKVGIALNNNDEPIYYTGDGTTISKLLHSSNIESYNSGSATKLQNARTIWGQSFDGTSNVSGNMSSVGFINSAIKITLEDGGETPRIYSAGHNLEFGGVGYAHKTYIFRPSYSNSGTTEANLLIQNASASDTPTFTTTHSFSSKGVAYHSGSLGVGISPSYKLHVNGQTLIQTSGLETGEDNASLLIKRDSYGHGILLDCTKTSSTNNAYLIIGGGFSGLSDMSGASIHIFPTSSQYTNILGNSKSSMNLGAGTITFGSWNDTSMPLYIDVTNKKIGIKTVSPTSTLQVVGGIRSEEIQFTNLGSGTYDVSSLSNHQTYGLQIEGPLKSDSSSADKYPITFSWRGGFNSLGGIQFVCENSGNHINIKKDKTSLKLFAWSDATYIESGNSDFTANMPLKITGISGGNGSDLYLNFDNVRANGVVRASSGYVALGSHGTLLSLGAYNRQRVITTGWTASESDYTTIYIPGNSNSNDAYLKIRQWDLIYNGNTVIHSGNISNYVTASSGSSYLSNTGFGNGTLTWKQTSESFFGSNWHKGWASYLINNHGDGATYYNWVMAFPFWSYPYYKRMTGNTSSTAGWYYFVTQENIGSMSVAYAGNAGAWGGYSISVGSSAGSDRNTIYFVV